MTATQSDTEQQSSTKHVLWFKPADSLIRALSNGLLFAGTDMTLPAFAAVKFEFDGTELEVLTSDRYRACIEKVALDPTVVLNGQSTFDFLLPRDAAKAALAFLKANRRDAIVLTFDAETSTVRLQALESSAEYRVIDNAFPSMRQLFPAAGTAKAVDRIGFNAKFLADLGKVITGEKDHASVSVQLFGPNKPTLIEFLDGPRVLLMTYRLPS